MSTRLRLFEVGGEDPEFRPSPYCWRIRMALHHKELAFEPVPWHAMQPERIERSGGRTVPVLVHGDRWLGESWDIAEYLEATFPNAPALFCGDGDRAKARFVDSWVTTVVQPLIARIVIPSQIPLLAKEDREYYGERTLRKFGETAAQMETLAERSLERLQTVLQPLEETLGRVPYLGGDQPTYGDYIVFGAFQWARVASERPLLASGSAMARWFADLLGRFDGAAAAQPPRSHWPETRFADES